jgi:hypothetical protein
VGTLAVNLTGRAGLGLKPDKPERGTKDAERHIARVKALPCAVCGRAGPSDAHHCIHGRFGSRKVSDFDTIPLCKWHHQWGPEAIHNGSKTWEQKFGADTSYLPGVRQALDGDI